MSFGVSWVFGLVLMFTISKLRDRDPRVDRGCVLSFRWSEVLQYLGQSWKERVLGMCVFWSMLLVVCLCIQYLFGTQVSKHIPGPQK